MFRFWLTERGHGARRCNRGFPQAWHHRRRGSRSPVEASPVTHRADEQGVYQSGAGWFRVDPMAGCAVVTAVGEIDLYSAGGLHRAVLDALRFADCLVIDMSQVAFVDSSGLGVLIGAHNRANALGGSVSLVAPPPLVRRILDNTQLGRSFVLFGSLDEALSALSPH